MTDVKTVALELLRMDHVQLSFDTIGHKQKIDQLAAYVLELDDRTLGRVAKRVSLEEAMATIQPVEQPDRIDIPEEV